MATIPAGAVFAKTRAGLEEVRSRKLKLPSKLRTILILVDGAKPALLLREEARALGVAPDVLEQLERMGLIARAGSVSAAGARPGEPAVRSPESLDPLERYRAAQQFMNDTVVNAVGIKAFFFTLKLEKCSTVHDLQALSGAYHELIAKASGEAEAEILSRRLQELPG